MREKLTQIDIRNYTLRKDGAGNVARIMQRALNKGKTVMGWDVKNCFGNMDTKFFAEQFSVNSLERRIAKSLQPRSLKETRSAWQHAALSTPTF